MKSCNFNLLGSSIKFLFYINIIILLTGCKESDGKEDEVLINIKLTENHLTMYLGEPMGNKILNYTIDQNITNETVLWLTSNESVATVDKGKVSARGVGEAYITVKLLGFTSEDNCKVTVYPGINVALFKEGTRDQQITIDIGERLYADVASHPRGFIQKVYSTSLSPSVASIDKNGIITGLSYGKTEIIFETEYGYKYHHTVFVEKSNKK